MPSLTSYLRPMEPLFYITCFELALKREAPESYATARASLGEDCDYFSLDPDVKQSWAESDEGAEYRLLLADALEEFRAQQKAAEQSLKTPLTRKPRGRLSGLAERRALP